MLFLHKARLVILSQPKTGTVALESALAPHAGVVIDRPPALKHVSHADFMQTLAPMLAETIGLSRSDYRVVSVMREPLDWLGSTYRFLGRDWMLKNQDKARRYTGDQSFEQYVRQVCEGSSGRGGKPGMVSACRVAMNADSSIGVDLLFPYDDLAGLYQLLEGAVGKPVLTERRNVSAQRPLDLSDETRRLFEQTFAAERALHASLSSDGAVPPRYREPGALLRR